MLEENLFHKRHKAFFIVFRFPDVATEYSSPIEVEAGLSYIIIVVSFK